MTVSMPRLPHRSTLRDLLQNHPDAIAAVLCALLVFLGWAALQSNWLGLGLLLLPAAYVIGGYDSAREGLTTLLEEKELDVDLLMVVAALGAAALGLWQREYHLLVDGGVLILIFAISGALEGYAMRRTAHSIRSLMSLAPDVARVMRQGREQEVPVSQLIVGDEVRVRPGEQIPTDALVVDGSSTLNEAPITGESMPVEKRPGDLVYAGTLNGLGALRLRIHQPPESSLIQRVIRLVEQAQSEAPPSQQFIEQFERGYAKVIVLVGVLLSVLPPFVWGWSWETTIYRALIFLVVASPCALMAAIMPTLLSGIASGARQGILFKNGAQLEWMGKVQAIAFDKTGTLTTGSLSVVEVVPTAGETPERVLQLAAVLESVSEHPIGQAIVNALPSSRVSSPPAENVQAYPGRGILGDWQGQHLRVGKREFVQPQTGEIAVHLRAASDRLESAGNTVVWVAVQGRLLGLIAVADTVRPEAVRAIAQLKQMGIGPIVMLTGDNPRTAESVAQSVGVDQVYADLLPEDKLHYIQKLQKEYKTVAMIGDGINDAPALAQATVGIAIGATGNDVAMETADIVLMADRLDKVAAAVNLGRRSQRIVKQNITFALSFIVLLLIANFVGGITLPLGVIGHEGSTVLVTLSGLRLLR